VPATRGQAALFLFRQAAFTRAESNPFAFCRTAFRDELRFLSARLMKNVSILIPEPGHLGETFFKASVRSIVSGSYVNSPSGGYVETVFTWPDHFFGEEADISIPSRAHLRRPVLFARPSCQKD
jgi:hypothetical protein